MSTEVNNNKVPVHVSLIMDGNGRWAKERGKERVHGHFEGVESVHACVQAAARAGVKYLSVFAFSEENWNRPEPEVVALMGLMVKAMGSYIEEMAEQGIKFVVLGNRERLGEELNKSIDASMQRTAHNDKMTFIIFMSYSGKWDILQAAKKMALEMLEHPERKEDILAMGVDGFDRYLITGGIPDPDLIVRTSGENRLSNYLLWQSAYTEFIFVDTLWPDFRENDFNAALEAYAKRDRRYGKVK